MGFSYILLRFVGCGTHSNEAGFDLMMAEGVWSDGTIAHVRDVFDFDESRPFLSWCIKLASEDVTIVLGVRLLFHLVFNC